MTQDEPPATTRRGLIRGAAVAATLAAAGVIAWEVHDVTTTDEPPADTGDAIDLRDWGAVGDGTSRPLAQSFPTLAAARARFPQATALTNETDWAAAQSCSYANPGRTIVIPAGVDLVTNLPIDVRSGQTWTVDGTITNRAVRNTPYKAMDAANVFRVGNMHPVILNLANPHAWPVVDIGPVAAGQTTVTVTSPASVATAGVGLAPGDFVVVRADSHPAPAAKGTIYDYQQINRVVSWDPATGELALADAVKVAIAAPAKLCLNSGRLDVSTAVHQPWWMADQVTIGGTGTLRGLTPFGTKMGAWRCSLTAAGDFQTLGSTQAFVQSDIDVSGTFSDRMLEVKFAAQDSRVRATGRYVPSPEVPAPAPSVSIGEQASDLQVYVDLTRGPDFPDGSVAVDVYAQDVTLSGRVEDLAPRVTGPVVLVRSTYSAGRPPSDIDLSGLSIVAAPGRSSYVQVGVKAPRPAQPVNVDAAVTARSTGAPPRQAVHVLQGTGIDTTGLQTDAR